MLWRLHRPLLRRRKPGNRHEGAYKTLLVQVSNHRIPEEECFSFGDLTIFTISGYLQWVALLGSPSILVPSSKKDQYGDIQMDNGVSHSTLPGGLINVEDKLLYASVASMATIDIGKPFHSYYY